MTSQLWQVLVRMKKPESGDNLTCNDCFAIMELLLLGAELGLDQDYLRRVARVHLAHCPGCRESLLERLKQLAELADYPPQPPGA